MDHCVTTTRTEDTLQQAAVEMKRMRKDLVQAKAIIDYFKSELLQHQKRLVQLELHGI